MTNKMLEKFEQSPSESTVENGSATSVDSEEFLQRPLPRKLMTRIDLHVVPTLAVLYLVSFLDR